MCGRYSITSPPEAIRQLFGFEEKPNIEPRYNVAPTQEVPAVRLSEDGKRHFVQLRWGLIPFWADDASIGNRMINARSDKVAKSPAFRNAFKSRRCLVVADGFYEWQKRDRGPKQPYRITLKEGGPFGFAGLWEKWEDPDSGEPVESCTIITTDASPGIEKIHHRMPVIVAPDDFATWLDHSARGAALDLLRPFPSNQLTAYPVSRAVNKVRNDEPALIDALEDDASSGGSDGDQAGSSSEGGQGRLF